MKCPFCGANCLETPRAWICEEGCRIHEALVKVKKTKPREKLLFDAYRPPALPKRRKQYKSLPGQLGLF